MNNSNVNASNANARANAEPRTDLVATAAAQGTLNTFSKALAAAGLTETLKGSGPFTVFAPTDAAFARLPAGKVDGWMKPENKAELISVLKYHVTPGKVSGSDVGKLGDTKTSGGQIAKITTAGDRVKIDDANVTTADILSSNGVIHLIDEVLTPSRH
ncbi:MAG TPA: fasciclin domain-containing protein [Dokdonella sp.]